MGTFCLLCKIHAHTHTHTNTHTNTHTHTQTHTNTHTHPHTHPHTHTQTHTHTHTHTHNIHRLYSKLTLEVMFSVAFGIALDIQNGKGGQIYKAAGDIFNLGDGTDMILIFFATRKNSTLHRSYKLHLRLMYTHAPNTSTCVYLLYVYIHANK